MTDAGAGEGDRGRVPGPVVAHAAHDLHGCSAPRRSQTDRARAAHRAGRVGLTPGRGTNEDDHPRRLARNAPPMGPAGQSSAGDGVSSGSGVSVGFGVSVSSGSSVGSCRGLCRGAGRAAGCWRRRPIGSDSGASRRHRRSRQDARSRPPRIPSAPVMATASPTVTEPGTWRLGCPWAWARRWAAPRATGRLPRAPATGTRSPRSPTAPAVAGAPSRRSRWPRGGRGPWPALWLQPGSRRRTPHGTSRGSRRGTRAPPHGAARFRRR